MVALVQCLIRRGRCTDRQDEWCARRRQAVTDDRMEIQGPGMGVDLDLDMDVDIGCLLGARALVYYA